MTDDDIVAFLDARTDWMVLTTIGRDGFPHSVPLGYFRLDGDIYLGCRAGTQKVFNIDRNPHVNVMMASGRAEGDIKGIMIQGRASIVDTDADRLRLSQAAARIRGVPEDQWPQQATPGAVYIRVKPEKIISWDYSKPQE